MSQKKISRIRLNQTSRNIRNFKKEWFIEMAELMHKLSGYDTYLTANY